MGCVFNSRIFKGIRVWYYVLLLWLGFILSLEDESQSPGQPEVPRVLKNNQGMNSLVRDSRSALAPSTV